MNALVDVKVGVRIELALEKRELVLITKALCGKLRAAETQEAEALGFQLLEAFVNELGIKKEAAEHALAKAKEPT